jgi:hypothetical protein
MEKNKNIETKLEEKIMAKGLFGNRVLAIENIPSKIKRAATAVVLEYLNAGKMFTALDVAREVKKVIPCRNYSVSSVLQQMILPIASIYACSPALGYAGDLFLLYFPMDKDPGTYTRRHLRGFISKERLATITFGLTNPAAA